MMGKQLKGTKWCGKERYHFAKIDSTNKKAKELAMAGCSHGTLVTAKSQQAGVGRRGRSWSSEEETGIYMSLVLRPDIKTESAVSLTLVVAMAVARAINNLLKECLPEPVSTQIKWPNDIVLHKKRICGILTELSLEETKIDYIIVGIGINVSNRSFPEEIQSMASSILLETNVEFDKETLIEEVWKQFEYYYAVFLQTEDLQGFKDEYVDLLANQNNKVKVLDPNGEYEGIARGITNTGELLVETQERICEVSSGEVSVRGIYGYV